MRRRAFLTLAAFLPGFVGTSPAVKGARHPGTHHDASVRSKPTIPTTDWYPLYDVDIDSTGRLTTTLTAEGSEVPEILSLNDRGVSDLEIIEGTDAVRKQRGQYQFDTTVTDTIKYSSVIGNYTVGSHFETAVLENAIVFSMWEFLPVSGWKGGLDALPKTHRVTFNPPNDWTSAAPGIKTGPDTYDLYPNHDPRSPPGDMFVVGDFTVYSSAENGAEIRVVRIPPAEGPDPEALLDFMVNAQPHVEAYFDYSAVEPRLVSIAPTAVVPNDAGTVRGDGVITSENKPMYDLDRVGSHYLHNFVNTYTRFIHPQWIFAGEVNYLEDLVLRDMGIATEAEVRNMVEGRAYHVEKSAIEAPWEKGFAVLPALDMDIRARTKGDADIGDFVAPINDQRLTPDVRISRRQQLEVLMDITGVDYTDYYRRYIDGTEFPEVVLDGSFSISDPQPLDIAVFDYSSVEFSARELSVDQALEVSLEITNTGSVAGTKTLELLIDGEVATAEAVELDPGETTSVTFKHQFQTPGEHTAGIVPAIDETVIVDELEPTVSLESHDLSTNHVSVGQPVTLETVVANTGPAAGTLAIQVTANGDPIANTNVRLSVNETTSLSFEHTFEEPGTYELAVNDVPVGTVSVIEDTPSNTATQTPRESPAQTEGDRAPSPATTGSPGQSGMGVISAIAGVGSAVGYLLLRDESGGD